MPSGIWKFAARMLAFFSTSSAIDSVLGSLLATVNGTTAPFSAMSGEVSVISALCVGGAPPSAFTASLSDLVSKAALFQASARALPGLRSPAANASPKTAAPPVPLSTDLRPLSIVLCLDAMESTASLKL